MVLNIMDGIGNKSQIIAMGYPAEGVESLYRNSMAEVKRFFNTYHKGQYAVWNLCSERQYDLSQHFELSYRFGFDDHNPPPLGLIKPFCDSVDSWLTKDEKNVAAIHCKAGKGRTGLMVACYLVHSGRCNNADEALFHFGEERTKNGKGVTIPSQMRYVHYYEHLLRRGGAVDSPTMKITHIRLVTVPNFDSGILGDGCDPYFQVLMYWLDDHLQVKKKGIFDYKKRVKKIKHYKTDEKYIDFELEAFNLLIKGDVKLMFYDKAGYQGDDKMFHVWFHTAFVASNYLCFEKSVLDKACKDKENKRFDPGFKLEIFLHRVDEDVDVDGLAAEVVEKEGAAGAAAGGDKDDD